MAAQKVGFTPRLLRQVAVTGRFQAQLHWNLHSRAEFETCQLRPPVLGACKHTHSGPQITPPESIDYPALSSFSRNVYHILLRSTILHSCLLTSAACNARRTLSKMDIGAPPPSPPSPFSWLPPAAAEGPRIL